MLQENDWDFVQIQLNYLDWKVQDAEQLYTTLTKQGLPVIVMEPVRGGALANLGEQSTAILKETNSTASIASWAIRFAASLPNVLTVLSGMSDAEQLHDNIQTMQSFVPLSAQEYEVLAKATTAYRQSGVIPCTGCQYCMDCPAGVDIPKVFAIHNQYCITKNTDTLIRHMDILDQNKQAYNCVQCGECLSKCPQQLNIPKLMSIVAANLQQVRPKILPIWMHT